MRPDSSEYAPYYAGYVSLVPDGDIDRTLTEQFDDTVALLRRATPEQEVAGYAEGKWSVREALGHVVETERMFMARALWFARVPGADLPGMDQDAWVRTGGHQARTVADHLDEWTVVRASTVALLEGLPDDAHERAGIASGVRFTVRAFFWIVAGHELHHRRLFTERYGLA
ncbi:MAG TPA: DinB family protein [Longimicrobiales bacterium]|nr:DinB family protein [Longimicrobiales bacterium]